MLWCLNNRFCCLNTITERGLKLFFRDVKKKKKKKTYYYHQNLCEDQKASWIKWSIL